ncbi:MAG: hypothetical protein II822_05285 [Prevotella sp.]|nr:hypothetical protein [Prevotella sp.]
MEKHDYTAACIYLITVTTLERKRILGALAGDSAGMAEIETTALGRYVAEAFRKTAAETTRKTGCRVQVLHYKVMPDHFHGILYVRDTLPKEYSLGKIVAAWKSDCTHALWNDYTALKCDERDGEKASSSCALDFSSEKQSLFSSGFNDRILFRKGQLETWIKYLDDNPRRLWLKMHFPNRLRKVYDFVAGRKGHRHTAVGNTFLVTYPERLQVRCHRHLTEAQIEKEVAAYLQEARRGTVLISPFISPTEKAVYDACYEEKLAMIHIVNRGLDGKFVYPSGRDLTGCSEGFLLVLAPYADYSTETTAKRITRAECLNLNDFAADLANVTLKCNERDDEKGDGIIASH